MMALMVRRGPDDQGALSLDAHCRLGFRRLAILDLTPAGHQPMVCSDQRSALVFNGEVYNFQEIRAELSARGVRLRSRSDTEVVLEALNLWGIEAIKRFNGMFALAWYQPHSQQLVLARDHAGIKPLFYRFYPGPCKVSFASQLNCLVNDACGDTPSIRFDALNLYLKLHYTPPPYTIYENVYQLPPGHVLTVSPGKEPHVQAWWQLPADPEPRVGRADLSEQLEDALTRAVRRHSIADVPVGVFLSGGIDSPLVSAIARSQQDSSLQAFTLGTPGWSQDESEDAARYASELNVTHHLHHISEAQALATLYQVAEAQTEPFADYSILPTLLVSQLARDKVTVALSGDGGDELFFGYARPFSLLRNGADFRHPLWLRRALYYAGRLRIAPERSSVIVHASPGDYYINVNSRFDPAILDRLHPGLHGYPADFSLYNFSGPPTARRLANYSRYVEFYGQLQRCLRKVDLASMYHSLEVRVPILDREVIDASLAFDPLAITRESVNKKPLRDFLSKLVPGNLVTTTKRGFSVPLSEWLRGSMRPALHEGLLSNNSWLSTFMDRQAIQDLVREHVSGARDHKWALWTLLSLEWFHRTHIKSHAHAAN